MRLIATEPEHNALLEEIAERIRGLGIYPEITKYENGFGITVWSINDLDEIPAAQNWPREKRLRFMEIYGEKIGGATDDAWARMNCYVDKFLQNEKDEEGD